MFKTVKCDCGAVFSSRSSYRSHKCRVCPIFHPNRHIYVCSVCFTEYKKKDYYNKHILNCKKEQTVSEIKPIISINLSLNSDNKTSNIQSKNYLPEIESNSESETDTENEYNVESDIDSQNDDESLFDKNEYSPCEKKKNTKVQEVESKSQTKTCNIEDIKNKNNKSGYIYLLQEREFVRLNEPTYKIGRTMQTLENRFRNYPKGSHVIITFIVEDCFAMESILINLFNKNFIKKTEYGNEYFYGDVKLMKRIISKEIFLSYDN